jgi:hypothetical protein
MLEELLTRLLLPEQVVHYSFPILMVFAVGMEEVLFRLPFALLGVLFALFYCYCFHYISNLMLWALAVIFYDIEKKKGCLHTR